MFLSLKLCDELFTICFVETGHKDEVLIINEHWDRVQLACRTIFADNFFTFYCRFRVRLNINVCPTINGTILSDEML